MLAACLCSTGVKAEPGTAPFQIHLGAGYEENTSPLVRLTDEGALVRINGLQRLAGEYASVVADGMVDGAAPLDGRWSLSGRALWKRAPAAPDLDFGQAMAELAWHVPIGPGSVGAGAALQRLWIAGEPFRDTLGLRGDWTWPTPDGGHWVALLEVAGNDHSAPYRDLDSRTWNVSVHRRIQAPVAMLDGVEIEAGFGRERNAHGYRDLASRSGYLRLGVDRTWAGTTLSLGLTGLLARFDEALLPGVPPRRDRLLAWDATVAMELAGGRTLRLETAFGRNQANSALFDNRYRQIGLSLSASW